MPTALIGVGRAFEVEGEEAGEDFVVALVRWPTVGSGDGSVETVVREVEPAAPLGLTD